MIRLSTKERYATRIMIYLASKAGERPARKHEIAKSEALSADYVEQIKNVNYTNHVQYVEANGETTTRHAKNTSQ